jgi:hypothetical protein
MIDPVNRNIVAYTTNTMVVTYNKDLLPTKKCPPNGKSSSSLNFRVSRSKARTPCSCPKGLKSAFASSFLHSLA